MVTVNPAAHTSSADEGAKTVVPLLHGDVATLVSDQLPDRNALTLAMIKVLSLR